MVFEQPMNAAVVDVLGAVMNSLAYRSIPSGFRGGVTTALAGSASKTARTIPTIAVR